MRLLRDRLVRLAPGAIVVVLAPRLRPVGDHEFGRAFQSHADDLVFRDSKVVDQLVD